MSYYSTSYSLFKVVSDTEKYKLIKLMNEAVFTTRIGSIGCDKRLIKLMCVRRKVTIEKLRKFLAS